MRGKPHYYLEDREFCLIGLIGEWSSWTRCSKVTTSAYCRPPLWRLADETVLKMVQHFNYRTNHSGLLRTVDVPLRNTASEVEAVSTTHVKHTVVGFCAPANLWLEVDVRHEGIICPREHPVKLGLMACWAHQGNLKGREGLKWNKDKPRFIFPWMDAEVLLEFKQNRQKRERPL